ncbi:MAG TPA: hypothetical protein VFA18_01625 [Gemmataceae bacterium]|nr:hypothetical protein [Gemmataceae bacterium]
MWRIMALVALGLCMGCSSSKNASMTQTNQFLFQSNTEFFSTASMGGDPMPASTNGK